MPEGNFDSSNPAVPAVLAENTAQGDGVVGKGRRGVVGESGLGTGVFGFSKAGTGVLGECTAEGGSGVFGESTKGEGVRGVSHSPFHGGVVGTFYSVSKEPLNKRQRYAYF